MPTHGWVAALALALVLALSLVGSSSAFAMSNDGEGDRKGSLTRSVADMLDFDTGDAVGGASVLLRDRREIWLDGHTTGLDPNAAYTVWWVLFNEPENCSDGCGEDEVADMPQGLRQAAGVSVLWATGFFTDGEGNGSFRAHLERKNPPGPVLFGPGLVRPRSAEVHVVLRTHGPILAGRAGEQIGEAAGACEVQGCADQQASVHKP